MMTATAKARKADLLHVPNDLIEAIGPAAQAAGQSWQDWMRSLARRELARLAAEKPKKGRK